MKLNDLGTAGKAHWKRTLASFELADEELAVLRVACQALDDMETARAQLTKDGSVVRNAKGELKQHPAMLNLRDARTCFLRSMKQLKLTEARTGRRGIGRPSGTKGIDY